MTTDTKSKKTMPATRKKAPSRGGYRAGSGRPRGSTTKVTIESLLANIELAAGQNYAEILAQNYVGAISRADWAGVRDYDRAFMNKMIAEKVEVDMNQSEDAVAAKAAAFAQAIQTLTGK
jgi:hypothetical protein